MIKIPKPPEKTERRSRLAVAPPAASTAPDNLTKPSDAGKSVTQDLNFKVGPEFHRRFKMEAVARGMTMTSLLMASFNYFLETNGGTIEAMRHDLVRTLPPDH